MQDTCREGCKFGRPPQHQPSIHTPRELERSCIIATTDSTLFQHGINNVDNVPKAAEALGPIAGDFAYLLFAVGNNRPIMKSKVNRRVSNRLGWITTIAMSIAAAALLLTPGAGQ